MKECNKCKKKITIRDYYYYGELCEDCEKEAEIYIIKNKIKLTNLTNDYNKDGIWEMDIPHEQELYLILYKNKNQVTLVNYKDDPRMPMNMNIDLKLINKIKKFLELKNQLKRAGK